MRQGRRGRGQVTGEKAEGSSSRILCLPSLVSRGFTLLEVMIAVAILAMVLVSLLGLKSRSVQDVALAEHMTMATLLARRTMTETVLAKPLAPLEANGEYPEEEFAEYSWRKIVAPTPFPSVLEVRVAVSWREGDRDEMVELVSYE